MLEVQEQIDFNKYIAIPYQDKGRSEEAVDCWGLVRLIYKEELGIELPSFSSEYEPDDTARLQELFAQYKEGWERVEVPQAGDVVLFSILGYESHIGVVIDEQRFIHARDGHDSAIESFTSSKWNKRIVGFYRYNEKQAVVLNAAPHPLRTQRFTTSVPEGSTLREIAEFVANEYSIDSNLKSKITFLVNTKVISENEWDTTRISKTDTIEYRAVAGKNATRTILTIAVVAAAIYTGNIAAAAAGGSTTFAGAVAGVAASTAVTAIGTWAINKLVPIKPPAGPEAQGERQNMLTGGQNAANRYGSIPVVLGRVRMSPPLGANTFMEFGSAGNEAVSYSRDTYLRMMLAWGYGPLHVDESTLKIGDIPLTDFSDYEQETITYVSATTETETNNFNRLYSRDYEQNQPNLTLVADGAAETASTETYTYYSYPDDSGVGVPVQGTKQVKVLNTVLGAWVESAFVQNCSSFTVALSFPQGLRKIAAKGDSAGVSQPLFVNVGIEYKIGAGAWTSLGTKKIGDGTARKDGFTWTFTHEFTSETAQPVTVRVRRESGDNPDSGESSPTWQYMHECVFTAATSYRNAHPLVDPVGAQIVKTALRIKASEQLNAGIEGINAIVQTRCLDWNGSAWVMNNTSNPASLFRYILEHPGNARRISGVEKLDLPTLQAWHTWCSGKGYEYNSIVQEATSILDILREVATAGRASPAMVDGKWSVIVDDVKPNVIQHFSPHNSWGFEASKALPKLPHALKVQYNDEDQNYQQLELIIPYTGYTHETAELLETISLPGITDKALVKEHARWHMAVAKLRPEVYTLNTDIEYLVCNRGDRVKVMHDVPMWGTGSGRIRNRISGAVFDLDEEIAFTQGTAYTIRVRSSDGASITRDLKSVFTPTTVSRSGNVVTLTLNTTDHSFQVGDFVSVALTTQTSLNDTNAQITAVVGANISYAKSGADLGSTAVTGTATMQSGYYSRVTFATSTTATEVNYEDLFLFGEYQQEAQDCLVLSIEPMSNKSARLTLVDYGVTNDYNLFTDYTTLTNNVIFEHQLTTSSLNRVSVFGDKTPSVLKMYSSQAGAEIISAGVFQYNLKVFFTNAIDLPVDTASVEAQFEYNSVSTIGTKSQQVAFDSGSLEFTNVDVGNSYKVRLRYVSRTGETGKWTGWTAHTIAGTSLDVQPVSGFTWQINPSGDVLTLNWIANAETVAGYEVRTSDSGWGIDNNYIFQGQGTSFTVGDIPTTTQIYSIRAFDSEGNYSLSTSYTTFQAAVPNAVTLSALGVAFAVELSWVYSATATDIHSAELWVSDTNNRTNATLLATVSYPTDRYVHTGLGINEGHYYWVKVKSNTGTNNYSEWYPVSSTAGLFAQANASSTTTAVIGSLAGQITESELSTSLNTRVDLIDAPSSTVGSVNARLQAEVNTINGQIQVESHVRLTSVQEAANAALEAALAANNERVDRTADVALARVELAENLEDGLLAEASERTILAAQLRGGYDGTDLNAVTSGLIYQEKLARAEQDSALALSISLLSAGVGEQFDWKSIWYFDTGVDGWSGNGAPTVVSGFLRPANQASSAYVVSPAGLAVDTAKYAQVRLRIRKVGSPTFAGYVWWNAVSQSWDTARRQSITEPSYDVSGIAVVTLNIAWSATASVDQIRLDLSSAQTATDYFEVDWFAVGRPSPAASTAQILDEQAARAAADSAEATSRNTISTFLFGATDPTGKTLNNITAGLIYDEKTSRTSADSALSTSISTLSSTVTNLEGEVTQNTSDINTIETTVADLTSSSASQVTELRSVGKKLDEDSNTVLTNLLVAEANRVKAETEVALARQELKTDIQAGLSAEASARLTLETKVNDNQASLVNNYYTKSTVDSAIAQSGSYLRAYSNLGSKTFRQADAPTDRGTDPETAATLALQTGDLWFETDDGNKPWVWNATAWVSAQDSDIAAVDARVTTVETTKIGYCSIGGVASDHSTKSTCEAAGGTWAVGLPLATAVKQVSVTDANGGSAKIDQAFVAQKNLNDTFKLQYSIKLDNNGNVSGFGLYNTGSSSEFIVSSDTFAVATPSSSLSSWTASTAYAVGKNVQVAGDSARMLVCKTAGTSGGTQPSLTGKTTGDKITDGTVIWQIASRVPFIVTTTSTTVENTSFNPGVYIDGAFIASQTVSPDSIDTRGLLVKDANGNVLFGAGNALDFSNVGGATKPANNATVGAPSGTYVGSTLAQTVEANAANGASAYSSLGSKLDKQSTEILQVGSTTAVYAAGVRVGNIAWNGSGVVTTGTKGLALTPYGVIGHDGTKTTFAISTDGDATFAGSLDAASGTFAGALSAATGTFAGSLSAATGTFAGSLSAATGSFSGTVTATAGTIGGNTINSTQVSSPGYTPGGTGAWALKSDGSAEFQNVKVRGDIEASTLKANTVMVSTKNVQANAISAVGSYYSDLDFRIDAWNPVLNTWYGDSTVSAGIDLTQYAGTDLIGAFVRVDTFLDLDMYGAGADYLDVRVVKEAVPVLVDAAMAENSAVVITANSIYYADILSLHTWNKVTPPTIDALVKIVSDADGWYYIGTDKGGVYYAKSDDLTTWYTTSGYTLSNTPVLDIATYKGPQGARHVAFISGSTLKAATVLGTAPSQYLSSFSVATDSNLTGLSGITFAQVGTTDAGIRIGALCGSDLLWANINNLPSAVFTAQGTYGFNPSHFKQYITSASAYVYIENASGTGPASMPFYHATTEPHLRTFTQRTGPTGNVVSTVYYSGGVVTPYYHSLTKPNGEKWHSASTTWTKDTTVGTLGDTLFDTVFAAVGRTNETNWTIIGASSTSDGNYPEYQIRVGTSFAANYSTLARHVVVDCIDEPTAFKVDADGRVFSYSYFDTTPTAGVINNYRLQVKPSTDFCDVQQVKIVATVLKR